MSSRLKPGLVRYTRLFLRSIQRVFLETLDIVIPAFNAEPTIESTLSSVLEQDVAGLAVRVIVVDDGSEDCTASVAARYPGVTVIRSIVKQGRAAARNLGARTGSGELLAFLDSDCVFSTRFVLLEHIAAIKNGTDVSVGPVRMNGRGFWVEYQRYVAADRITRSRAGMEQGLTSANFMLPRTLFESIGGFDQRYVEYGFEDRDLFLRLLGSGAKVGLTPGAAVSHDAHLTMSDVCRKMYVAGRYTSGIFMASHPKAYAMTHFARADTRLQGRLFRIVTSVAHPFLPVLAMVWDRAVTWHRLPFRLRRAGVKLLSGLAFAVGTSGKRSRLGVTL